MHPVYSDGQYISQGKKRGQSHKLVEANLYRERKGYIPDALCQRCYRWEYVCYGIVTGQAHKLDKANLQQK